ncbi:hypothetical protein [uncultured Parabacteroides sp.]|uniref:hypothetical protein n=1 Tax=uncultured Parabacteroides sp. TaxID=512312 RepID=UPI002587313D|nr:hypothetical protein [uncultured Parabacteroides sp.]
MKRIICFSLLLLFIISCGKEDDIRSLDISMVKLDLADAEMLAVCGKETKTKSGDEDLGLFKIDKKGKMSPVVWVMPGTTDTIHFVPQTMLPLNDEYVLFSDIRIYNSNPNTYYYFMNEWYSYVVRKKDGAVFMIDGDRYPAFNHLSDQSQYAIDANPRTDKLNNAYCLADKNIYKFALNALDDITMQQITLDQFPIYYSSTHPFEVDFKGNCITSIDDNRVILYKTEGGLYEFPQEEKVFDYFVGYNGGLYCCSCMNEENYSGNKQYKIYPLEVGVQVSYDFENAISKDTQTNYSWNGSKMYTLENGYIHVLLATDDTNNMLVYNSKEETIKEVGFLPGTLEDVVGVSNNSIYRIMENKILKYDFVSNEKSMIPIDFDFNSCSVYKEWSAYNVPNGSKFILGAIRNSDMAILRIEVDMESGKATTFEDQQDRPIVTLVQIK